ncbi:Aldehyde/histidinol dehydrogenase [Sporodiniella umbellata]|nr:Aldehyde/histidinol dehydrogenase [Sporodiniella umbellata]
MSYTPIEEIPQIVSSLHKTFQSGLTRDVNFRKQQLANLAKCLRENKDLAADALYKDLRKHRLEADIGEIAPVIDECEYMIRNLDQFTKLEHTVKRSVLSTGTQTYVRKEPKGVVLVIGAWNYPINLLLLPVVGAIAAGNCVVIKPSEISENVSKFVSVILPKYLDPRAYTVVTGGVPETTAVLEQRFEHIFYTGNGQVAKTIMKAASNHLASVTLELGGKSPVFVTSHADLNVSAHRLLWGKFFNVGQTCVAPDYALVTEDIYDQFVDVCKKTLKEFYGNHPEKSESLGRIVSARQFDRLKSLLDKCDPNTIIAGGVADRESLYIAPTIVGPLSHNDSNLMEDEIFGPILPLIVIKDIDEGINIVNSRDYPLALYVFSSDKKEYNHILDKTNSGGVTINDTLVHLTEHSLPFGGVGPSGNGNYHGEASFNTFTHQRSTMVKNFGMESVNIVRYPPYTEEKTAIISSVMYDLPGNFSSKIKAIRNVCSAFWGLTFKKSPAIDNSKL